MKAEKVSGPEMKLTKMKCHNSKTIDQIKNIAQEEKNKPEVQTEIKADR
jgi:hypothetical protein